MALKDKETMKRYEDADIKVLMLGANRVGKTSLLARMVQKPGDDADTAIGRSTVEMALSGTKLTLNKERIPFLEKGLEVMKSYYNDKDSEGNVRSAFSEVHSDNKNANTGNIDFTTELTTEKKNGYTIAFSDIPGEWVKQSEEPEFKGSTDEKVLTSLVQNADILIITVDAPLIMERGGVYAETGNRISKVHNLITTYYTPDNKGNNYKMVLFVPVKCEKYFNDHIRHQKNKSSKAQGDPMETLISKIESYYAPTINYLQNCKVAVNEKRGEYEKCVDIGILPVLTLGNMEFYMFKNISSGEVNGDNMVLQYSFDNSIVGSSSGQTKPKCAKPKFCEIPLIYILLFALAKVKKFKEDGRSFWDVIKRIFRNMASDKSLLQEVVPLKNNLASIEPVDDIPNPYVFKFIQSPMLDKLNDYSDEEDE